MDKRHVLRALGRGRSGKPALFAGRYALVDVVGEGSTGAVWRAHDGTRGTTVALKFFSTKLCTPAVLETRQSLIQALRQCRHPAVVAPEEIVASGECAAIVMPWVDGLSLARWHRRARRGARSIDEISSWLAALLAALEDVHARGLVHGALHPGVIFPEGDDVKVVGWEMNAWLRRITAQATRSKLRIEGKACLSPAVREGQPPTAADDIFAVGAVLHLLLTGSPAPVRQHDDEPAPVLRHRAEMEQRGADRTEVWEEAAQRCLQPTAADRFASVRALRLWLGLEDMSRVLAAPPVDRDAPPPPQQRETAEVVPTTAGATASGAALTDSKETPAVTAPSLPPEETPAPIESTGATPEDAPVEAQPAFAVSGEPPAPSAPDPDEREARVPTPAEPASREATRRDPEPAPAAIVHASWAVPAQFVPAHSFSAHAATPLVSKIETIPAHPHPAQAASSRATAVELEPGRKPVAVEPPVAKGSAPAPPARSATPARHAAPAPPSWRSERARTGGPFATPPARTTPPPSAPVRGVFMLRTMITSISLLTIAAGGWFVWQIVEQRYPEVAHNTERTMRATGTAVLESLSRRFSGEPTSSGERPAPRSSGQPATGAAEFTYGSGAAPTSGELPESAGFDDASDDAVRVQQPIFVMPAPGSTRDGGIFDLANVDAPPRPVAAQGPLVSRNVLARTAPGHVEIVLVIDRSGQVASAEVRSASNPELVQPCLEAARGWRFIPATRDGRAVAVRAMVPLALRSP